MPYLVVCPKCSAKLKTSTPVPAGRSVSCPQCKLQFTLDKPAAEIEGTGPTPVMATKPAEPRVQPKPAPRASSETASSRKGREADEEEIPSADIVDAADFDFASKPKPKRRRDEDEDDRPRSRSRRDEDDEDDRPAPRKKRNEDEEEDRPRARRKREDDEEEERPKSRSRRDEEEEDERPAPRRKREDDEEDERPKARKGRVADDEKEEERPKARKSRANDDDEEYDDDDGPRPKSRKGKKNKKVLLLALIGGGAAFLFLLCAGIVLFADPFGLNLFGSSSSEMLAWAPADSQNIIYMDVEGMEKVDAMKGNFKGDITDSTKLGLKQDEVSAVMGAGRIVGGGDPDVTIIKLRTKADQQKIINTSGGKEATTNGKKYYKTSGGGGLYFASDKMLVVAKTDAIMTSLLQKDSGKVVISDDLKSAAKRGDGLVWMAGTGQAAEKGDLIGLLSGNVNFGGFGPAAPKAQSKCKSTLMSMKASGTQGTSRIESTYDSSDTAKKIADDLKKAMDQAKAKSNDGNTFDVSSSGSTVTLTVTGPIKPGKGMIPGLPGF
jgi:hypothetical protein